MVQLVFLGPPGAGKGTQASVIAESYGIPHISTGEILRAHVAQETELGKQAKIYMERGDLVPDQLILDMVEQRLNAADAQQGWLLDGFPRTVSQAEFVDQLLEKTGNAKLQVLNLDVADTVLISRLLARGRQDDTEETIRNRLQVYRQQTAPLIEFYQQRQQLVTLNGDQSIDDVTANLKQAITVS